MVSLRNNCDTFWERYTQKKFFLALHKKKNTQMFRCNKGLQCLPDTWHCRENCDYCFTWTSLTVNFSPQAWRWPHTNTDGVTVWTVSVSTLVGHLRCCRCCWLCAWLKNRFDRRDLRLLSHLVGEEDQIYGDKIPISWTAAKCQSCFCICFLQSQRQGSKFFVIVNGKSHQCGQTERHLTLLLF